MVYFGTQYIKGQISIHPLLMVLELNFLKGTILEDLEGLGLK